LCKQFLCENINQWRLGILFVLPFYRFPLKPLLFFPFIAGLAEVGVDPVGLIDYADTIFAQVSKMKTCIL